MVEHSSCLLNKVGIQVSNEGVGFRCVGRNGAKPLANDSLHARLEPLKKGVIESTGVEFVKKSILAFIDRQLFPRFGPLSTKPCAAIIDTACVGEGMALVSST